MSLGVSAEVEDQIKRCVNELGGALAPEVAWMRFENGLQPLLCHGEVGEAMLRMQEKGVLVFRDGVYVVAQEVEE